MAGVKKLKIGIITFWWSHDNYGQLLQCYALQKYLRNMGHEPFLIRYIPDKDYKKSPLWIKLLKACNPFLLYKFLKRNFVHLATKKVTEKLAAERTEHNRCFDDFRNKFLKVSEKVYESYDALFYDAPEADIYITGSDQVFNYHFYPQKAINAYFLNFGSPDARRISYGASWGMTMLPGKYKKAIEPLLQKFDYVSVREKTGIDLCRECGRNDAEWVCDPTLLLDAEKYRAIYRENEIRKPDGKFLLLYMLANECDFDIQTVYDFAASKGLEVVYVTGNGVLDKRKKYFATIPEWLYLVDNAEYVITNSFHCAVFSTIFHKQFGVIPLSGSVGQMNSRFDALFEIREMHKRYVSENDFSILDIAYDCSEVAVSKRFVGELQ